MAIDSANKRFSILNFGNPVSSPLIVSDGTIGDGDRYHFLNLYYGITLEAITETPTIAFSLYGSIDPYGESLIGEITALGSSVLGRIDATFGLNAIISSQGKSINGSISSDGISLTGKIK